MNKKKPQQPSHSLDTHLKNNIIQNATISDNLGIHVIRVTEDKIRLAVKEHLERIETKNAWQAPLGLVISISISFATSEFKNALFLDAATWRSIFILGGMLSTLWLIISCFHLLNSPTEDDFVNSLQPQAKEETTGDTKNVQTVLAGPLKQTI